MKTFIGCLEVAGVAVGLKTGFDRIGAPAELVLSQPHPFSYPGEVAGAWVVRVWRKLGENLHLPPGRRARRLVGTVAWKAWSFVVWLWALRRFDAFIFVMGSTITNSALEAWSYKRLRKKVVVVYCGSDARPAYIDGLLYQAAGNGNVKQLERLARKARRRVALHERVGFACVNAPTMGHFHAGPFVNWFAMGVPRGAGGDQSDRAVALAVRKDGAVRVLHSPSNRDLKGTDRIEKIVRRLQDEGHAVEFVLLHGLPNAQVVEELKRCDFVIDQCYSDSPMAAFAAEAASFGKPAVVGGYAADETDAFSTRPPPTLFVHPEALEGAIRRMVVDGEFRRALGERARAFIEEQWAPERVAERYRALLERGAAPSDLVSPASVRYLHGYAMTEQTARATVGRLVAARGAAALQLRHNPALEQAFLRFALHDRSEGTPPMLKRPE